VKIRTLSGVELSDPALDPETSPHFIPVTVQKLSETSSVPGNSYRMVSVPLDLGPDYSGTLEAILADENEFGSYDPTRWRAFRYLADPGRNVELSEEPPDQRLFLRPGRSYWLISRTDHTIDTAPAAGRSLSPVAFPVTLDPGWNQFANPFAFPVSWEAVAVSDGDAVGEPVAFDPVAQDYWSEHPAVLEPFSGYFVRNFSEELQTLWIPPVEAAEGGAGAIVAHSPRMRQGSDRAWEMHLRASASGAGSGTVAFGVHELAHDDYDGFDVEMPPAPPGRWVSVAVANRDWRHRPGLYRRDLRDAQADGHTWEIEILTQERAEDVTLGGSWEPAPAGDLALRLVDLEQSVSVDLGGGGGAIEEYRLVSFGAERPYRVAILAGTPDWVLREGDGLVERPVSLSLDRNAPNPFRHATRIRFGLPQPASCVLTIFNLEGRRVARLVDGEPMPAGFHTAVWDGRDDSGRRVVAGVYFYRLEAGDVVLHRKMLVLW